MKNVLFFLGLSFLFSLSMQAQRMAYVDSDYILSNVPEFKAAQKQLEDISVEWQKEIETKLTEIDAMYRNYQVEKILLSEEMRIKKEDEILAKEKAVKELQKKRFAPGGDFFKKQEELIRPIQDKVFNAISSLAEDKNYSMVLDKAGSTTVMYGNKRFDISNDVIKEMGLVPGAIDDEDSDDEDDPEDEDSKDQPIKIDKR
ncbi:MAG: OmpH family outer membrane protein [Bacteroidetes bacterium]|jgi:outer membrane protein|nr:OmpH family outer membrane protein [Bacteroidota bacterium]